MSHFRTLERSDPRFEHAGLLHLTVKSSHLKGRGDITVFAPKDPGDTSDLPIVLLLHGIFSSHWAWTMKGGAHLTTQRLIDAGTIRPMILAMPSDGLWGDGSGYLPHASQNFERWITEDVPQAVRETIPAATAASPLFITGLSMGGFGALRLGALYSKRFAGISALSAVTNQADLDTAVEEDLSLLPVSDWDVADLLIAQRETLPPLRFDCGTEDVLLPSNRTLHRRLREANVPHQYEEFPGDHSWPYWETHLTDTLLFFESLLP